MAFIMTDGLLTKTIPSISPGTCNTECIRFMREYCCWWWIVGDLSFMPIDSYRACRVPNRSDMTKQRILYTITAPMDTCDNKLNINTHKKESKCSYLLPRFSSQDMIHLITFEQSDIWSCLFGGHTCACICDIDLYHMWFKPMWTCLHCMCIYDLYLGVLLGDVISGHVFGHVLGACIVLQRTVYVTLVRTMRLHQSGGVRVTSSIWSRIWSRVLLRVWSRVWSHFWSCVICIIYIYIYSLAFINAFS